MPKREQRQATYRAEIAADRQRAESRAAFGRLLKAMDAAIQDSEQGENWRDLVSDARKAESVSIQTARQMASITCTWMPLDWYGF